MRLIQALIILGVPWVMGRFLLQRLGARCDRPGLAYPVGAALLSTVLCVVGGFGLLGLPTVIALSGTAIGLVVWMRGVLRWPGSGFGLVELPSHVLCISLVLTAVTTPITGFDAIAFWSARARAIYHAGSIPIALSVNAIPHSDYPLLSPILEVWAYLVSGGVHDTGLAKLHHPVLLVSTVVALRHFLRQVGLRRPEAEVFPFLLAAMPALRSTTVEVWSDLPLAVFNGLAGLCAVAALRERAILVPFALMVGASAATKLEGSVTAACLTVVFVFAPHLWITRRRRVEFFVSAALGFAVGTAPWLILRATMGLKSEYAQGVAPGFVAMGESLPEHLLRVLHYVAHDIAGGREGTSIPGLFGLAFLALLVIGAGSSTDSPAREGGLLLTAAIGLQLLAYIGIFLVSPYLPSAQLPVAMARLLMHLAPLVVIACALLFRSKVSGASSDQTP